MMPDEPVSKAEKPELKRSEGLIYHYTDQNGLDGILSNDCIWATHYRFLNDSSEREHGFDLFCNAVDQVHTSRKQLRPEYRAALKETLKNYFARVDSYHVSFTEDNISELPGAAGDRLSQWRGYALGRQGFSMGFDHATMHGIAESLWSDLSVFGALRKCTYSNSDKVKAIEDHVAAHFDIYCKVIADWQRTTAESEFQPFSDPVYKGEFYKLRIAALLIWNTFKHEGFSEECETRMSALFVHTVSESHLIRFRSGQHGQTPYIEVPLRLKQQSCLRRIVVGPSSNKEQIVASLRIRLAQMGIQGVEIIPSKIPYRNW